MCCWEGEEQIWAIVRGSQTWPSLQGAVLPFATREGLTHMPLAGARARAGETGVLQLCPAALD